MDRIKIHSHYRGRRVTRTAYVGGSKWQAFKASVKRAWDITCALGMVGALMFLAFFAGRAMYPVHIIEQAKAETTIAPVLNRIAACESRSSQTCTDDLISHGLCAASEKGQIVTRANNNHTVDVGKYQINEFYYGAVATKLGFNIFTEEGNEAMAEWIYSNEGTGAWSASQKCWK